MVEVKFIEDAPAPGDFFTSVSQLLRDAAVAIDMFGEGKEEASSRERRLRDRPSSNAARPRCCLCGEDVTEKPDIGRGICPGCRDSVARDPARFIDWVFSASE